MAELAMKIDGVEIPCETLADGTICFNLPQDMFAAATPAPAAGTDSFGNDYAAGDAIITFPDGTVACIPPKTESMIRVVN